MVLSSESSQAQMGSFEPLNGEALGQFMGHIAEDPSRLQSVKDIFRFNLPFCDLGKIQITWDKALCHKNMRFDPIEPYRLNWGLCLHNIVLKSCYLSQLNGNQWPYGE